MNWGVSKSQSLMVCAFLLLMLLLGWRIFSARPAITLPGPAENYEPQENIIPNLFVENLRVTYSRGGTKERILHFKRARQCPGPDGPIYEVEAPRVIMAKQGDMEFTVEAEEGSFDPRSGDWTLAGNVHAASGTVREFYADWARYFAEREQIVARGDEHPLRLIDEGFEIEGRELRTDSNFEMIEIMSAGGEIEGDFLPNGEEQVNEQE
jgi:hypothetical protein